VATIPGHRHLLDSNLQRALALVDGSRLGAAVTPGARAESLHSAHTLHVACGADEDAIGLVTLAFTAELLAVVAVDLAADRPEAERLIGRLGQELGISQTALGRELLRTGRLLDVPVESALEVALSLLLAFAGGDEMSLFQLADDGELELVAHAGVSSANARDTAAQLLRDSPPPAPTPGTGLSAVRIKLLRPRPAALVASGPSPETSAADALLAAATPPLAALLDRRELLREQQSPDRVLGAVERRLARLRFDLHDGPQQDIHLLAQDLRLFRDQLRPMIEGDPNRERALGRLDDLEAQLVALDGDLRRLATTVQSPFLAPTSLPEALRQLTDAFASRTGVVPHTQLRGAVTSLTDSQQITLLSLVREALTNIRQHSDADKVEITIAAGEEGVDVEVSDDGNGFEPESTLVKAARAGRLGLVGMHERVRMLGGSTKIDSRPGGPTMVSATLPRWPTEE
jgi:signal transduction histidine kinase